MSCAQHEREGAFSKQNNMPIRSTKPGSNRGPLSPSATSLPPIGFGPALLLSPRDAALDQPSATSLDTLVGTGTGRARNALPESAGVLAGAVAARNANAARLAAQLSQQPSSSSSALAHHHHPAAAVAPHRLETTSALADFMTFAEAPAFFDLPIPLYSPPRPSVSAAQLAAAQGSGGRFGRADDDDPAATSNGLSFSSTADARAMLGRTLSDNNNTNGNGNATTRLPPLTMTLLEPLQTFSTADHLRSLDQALSAAAAQANAAGAGPGDRAENNNSMYDRYRGKPGEGGAGGGGGAGAGQRRGSTVRGGGARGGRGGRVRSVGGAGTDGAFSGGGGGHRGGGVLSPSHPSLHPAPEPTTRVILPRCIAEMIQSLRPTHYAPLRKAMCTRSHERQYEDDAGGPGAGAVQRRSSSNNNNKNSEPKESDAALHERLRIDDVRRLAAVGSRVGTWQEQADAAAANDTLVVGEQRRAGSGSRLASRPPTSDSPNVSRRGWPHSSMAQQQQHEGGFAPDSSAGDGSQGRLHRSGSPLATVHAGRRPSIATALMIGDLGAPSRQLPTHGRAPLLESAYDSGDNSPYMDPLQTLGGTAHAVSDSPSNFVESTMLLANVSPDRLRRRSLAKPRMSVCAAAEEQSKNPHKTEEFHRDMLAWYRTEATMLRVTL